MANHADEPIYRSLFLRPLNLPINRAANAGLTQIIRFMLSRAFSSINDH